MALRLLEFNRHLVQLTRKLEGSCVLVSHGSVLVLTEYQTITGYGAVLACGLNVLQFSNQLAIYKQRDVTDGVVGFQVRLGRREAKG